MQRHRQALQISATGGSIGFVSRAVASAEHAGGTCDKERAELPAALARWLAGGQYRWQYCQHRRQCHRRRIAWDLEVAPLRWRPSWAMRRPGGGGGTDGSPATVARRPTLLSLSSLTGLLHAAGVGDEGLLVDLEAWRLQWVHASKAMACSVQRPLVGGAGMGAAAFAALGERQVTIVGFAGISLEAYALCLGSQLAGNTGVALSVKMVHLSDVQGLLRDVADAAERRFGELAALAERGRVDPVAPIARASLGSGEMQLLATSTAYSAFLYACQMSPFCFYRFAILYLALLIGLL